MAYAFQLSSRGCPAEIIGQRARFFQNRLLDNQLKTEFVRSHENWFLIVSTSDSVLEDEIQRIKQTEAKNAFFISQYQAAAVELDESPRKAELSPREKDQLVRALINQIELTDEDRVALEGLQIHLEKETTSSSSEAQSKSLFLSLIQHQPSPFLQVFPLHDQEAASDLWQKNRDHPFALPSMSAVRSYFGSKTALFFGWTGTYYHWLMLPAVVSVLIELHRYSTGDSDRTFEWLYTCLMMLWSALVLKFWRRRNAKCVLEWDFNGLRADRAVIRWEMRGQKKMYEATSKSAIFTRRLSRYRLFGVTLPAIGFMLLLSIVVMFGSLNVQGYIKPASFAYSPLINRIRNRFWLLQLPFAGTVVASTAILLTNKVYCAVASQLTNFEDWETDREREAAQSLKRIPFELFNASILFLYLGFWERNFEALRSELTGMMITDLGRRIALEVVVPFALAQWHRISSPRSVSLHENGPEVFMQSQMPLYDTFDDWMKFVSSWMHVLMFAALCPRASFLALLGALFDSKAILFKLCFACQRSQSEKATNIGVWLDAMDLVGRIAVVSNCALVFLSLLDSSQLVDLIPITFQSWYLQGNSVVIPSMVSSLLFVIVVEHVVMALRWLINTAISDMPTAVQDIPQEQNQVRERALKKWRAIRTGRSSTPALSPLPGLAHRQSTSKTRPEAVIQLSRRTNKGNSGEIG